MLSLFYKLAKSKAPRLSETEKEALSLGDPWWEADVLSGSPSWLKLKSLRLSRLEPEEQAFLENETEVLCNMLDEWQIVEGARDLPPEVWDYMRDAGFWGLVIPKAFGGKGFSAALHSAVVMKVATKSLTAAVTVMVPNSLGPGELIGRYGTQKQKDYYLPRLARGDEIPCFALTSTYAGSDATSMIDYGVVCKGDWKGKKVLGIRLSFCKRYITLAPVATLVGLAFKLRDPEQLLGETEDLGITLCLLERNTPGLILGNRHLPLNQAFMNGTVEGYEVFVPMDAVIGGKESIGKGWLMLMECLSVGRAISLPAISTAYGALSFMTVGAYASLREQFHLPLKAFEGVQAAMAEVAGFSYILDACRLLTLTANDQNQKPAVASAIAKYHMTELARKVLNHAMDIHGGRGIMMGPSNYLAHAYQGIPICITVEGANILTRNLMIFGQGVMLDQPYLRKMAESLNLESKAGKKQFSRAFWGFVGHHIALLWSRVWTSLTGGFFIETPDTRLTRQYRKISIMSNRFALLTDVALTLLGGKLKRKEALSARLGDAMSHLYMASAVLKYYQNVYEPEAEEGIAKWSVQYCLHKTYMALSDFIDNFARWPFRPLMRLIILPFKHGYQYPSDKSNRKLAEFMAEPSALRDRFKAYCHALNNNDASGLMTLEPAYAALQSVKPLLKILHEKVKANEIDKSLNFFQQIEAARDQEIFNFSEWQALYEFALMREDAMQVDAFTPDLHLARRSNMNMNVSLESQFKDLVERVRNGNVNLNPTPAQKLELYALYKQATEGDVSGEAPGATDFIARAKYQAWEKCKGMTASQAMQKYIEMFG